MCFRLPEREYGTGYTKKKEASESERGGINGKNPEDSGEEKAE